MVNRAVRWAGIAAIVGISVSGASGDRLLEQGYFAPEGRAAAVKADHRTQIRFRTEALVQADEKGEIRIRAACAAIGRYRSPLSLTLTPTHDAGASEKRTVEAGDVAELLFRSRPGSVRQLVLDAKRNAYTVECLNGPLAFPAEMGATPFHGIRRAGPVYVYVPKGANRFRVKLEGEGTGEIAAATLYGPAGAEVLAIDTVGVFERSASVDVPAGMDGGVWRVEMGRVPGRLFEDFAISFDGDVVPYVSESPSGLLAPLFGVHASSVAWQIGRDAFPSVTACLYTVFPQTGLSLKYAVQGPDGSSVRGENVDVAGKTRVTLGLPGTVPAGEYIWSVSAVNAGGAPVMSREGVWMVVPRPKQMTATDGLLHNGKPFFPRGLYHVAPGDYALVAAHGFNCVQTKAGVPPVRKSRQSWCNGSVAEASRAGLKSCVALYWSGRPNSEEWRRQFKGVLKHPDVLVWMIQDEPDGRFLPVERMARSYSYLRTHDPERPAYTCLCRPQTYGKYGPQTDYMSLDVYPIGRSPITRIADSLERAQRVVPQVPFWFIGQIWPWKGKPNVTPAQHRCMTYLALTHGARGLMWYSFRDPDWYVPEGNPPLWAMMKTVNDELEALEPFLFEPNTREHVVTTGDGDGVHTSLKCVGNRACLIAVNPSDRALQATIPVAEFAGASVDVLFEDRSVLLPHAAITDRFGPLAVHIYVGRTE